MFSGSKKKHFSKVTLYGFPLGWLFSHFSHVSDDDTSLNGIFEAKEIVDSKKEGLSVFFAHLGVFDVFGTACAIEKVINYKAVFPVAASWYYFPLVRSLLRKLDEQVPHEFYPVFRKEEMGYSTFDVTFVDFSGLDQQGKREANKAYVDRSLEMVSNGGVLIVAPYGGRAPKIEFLRSGPLKTMQQGKPIILSLTKWNWKRLKYDVFFSKVYTFPKTIDKKQAHKLITKEFFRMAKLSKLTKEQVLHAKSSNGLEGSLWRMAQPILTLILSVKSHL